MIPLRHIHSVSIAQEVGKHLVYKYGPLKKLLAYNWILCTSSLFQIQCQQHKISNRFTSMFPLPTNARIKWYSQNLTPMLCWCVNDQQQDWNAYASKFAYGYNSQVHSSINTCQFDVVLNQRILDFTIQSVILSRKIVMSAEQTDEFWRHYYFHRIKFVRPNSARKNATNRIFTGVAAKGKKK